MNQILLEKIGEILSEKNIPKDCKIIKCDLLESGQNVPLFCSGYKSPMTEYCNVDALILKNNKIEIIIKVNDSEIRPVNIFGVFLAAASSTHYLHETNEISVSMVDSVLFIQIIDTDNLNGDANKPVQFRNIEDSINENLPLNKSKIKKFKLIISSENLEKSLINAINKHLNS